MVSAVQTGRQQPHTHTHSPVACAVSSWKDSDVDEHANVKLENLSDGFDALVCSGSLVPPSGHQLLVLFKCPGAQRKFLSNSSSSISSGKHLVIFKNRPKAKNHLW